MANFTQYSRYIKLSAATNRSGKNFLVLRNALNLDPADGDVFITITQDITQRPDLISSKAYGRVDLWWVIYEFNGIKDPLFELQMNQILRIPSLNRVLDAIKQLNFG